jgi:hypothetical protein
MNSRRTLLLIGIAAVILTVGFMGTGSLDAADHLFAQQSDADGVLGVNPERRTVPEEWEPYERFFPADPGVKAGKAANLLFDLSHNPFVSISSSYSAFISLAQGLGFNVVIANDFANLQNYDVVIQTVPQLAFSSQDAQDLVDYLNGGGILLLWTEFNVSWWSNSQVNLLLDEMGVGIQINDELVADQLNAYNGNEKQIKIHDFTSHCLNDGVSLFLHPAVAPLELDNPSQALYFSAGSSYFFDMPSTTGPFPLAAIPDPAVHPNWKMAVVGDQSQFTSSYFIYDNPQLAENWLLWCEQCQVAQDCDDGVFCNGEETCNQQTFMCEPGTAPCPDDGLFCNGDETCDEVADQCNQSGDPCPDDGAYCNGAESCDEANDLCDTTGDPCPDDGAYCNGVESCDEAGDLCLSSGDPCVDNGVFCDGPESCDEVGDSCNSTGDPCLDDGLYCNGVESCDEAGAQCLSSGEPCLDDGDFCNGSEQCDEDSDSCSSTGNPCADDEMFCNGTESCDELNGACISTGNPCPPGEACDEIEDLCQDDSLDNVDDDEDEDDEQEADGGDEELWPEGKVTGGCCSS